jgi:hypothetical protein
MVPLVSVGSPFSIALIESEFQEYKQSLCWLRSSADIVLTRKFQVSMVNNNFMFKSRDKTVIGTDFK